MRNLLTAGLGITFLFAAGGARAEGQLGSKDPGLLNLKGKIYELSPETDTMPGDLDRRTPTGVIYTDRLDVPPRSFTEGFPGVTNRFEWFGIVYTGTFQIDKPGRHRFRASSDDGTRVWIDDQQIIDNDGVHPVVSVEGEVDLAKGSHSIKVWYFQGPATEIAVQLFITPPGGVEKIFVLGDFAKNVGAALRDVKAEATPEGIRVRLDAAVLFDTGKDELKKEARRSLDALAEVIRAYPGAAVRIDGHTDSVGDDASNQALSERRAAAVKEHLTTKVGKIQLEAKGFGESAPVADNGTEKGRARNRRVEVLIKP